MSIHKNLILSPFWSDPQNLFPNFKRQFLLYSEYMQGALINYLSLRIY